MKKDCQSSGTKAEGTGQGTGLKQQQKHLILRDRGKGSSREIGSDKFTDGARNWRKSARRPSIFSMEWRRGYVLSMRGDDLVAGLRTVARVCNS